MPETPSIVELLERLTVVEVALAQANARIAVLEEENARIAVLEEENAQLRRRLGQNSTNSSKPPSSDSPFAKPAPKSLRRKSGRKPGGGMLETCG